MKLTVQSSALAKELSLISAAAGKSNLQPALQSIRLDAKDGVLSITATDLQVAMQSRISVSMDKPGAVCLPAERLRNLLRFLPDSSLSLSVSDNLRALIACNGTSARIPGIHPTEFPDVPMLPPDPLLRAKASELSKLIRRVAFAIAAQPGKFASTIAQLELEGDFISLGALDGHRLAYCEVPAEISGPSHRYLVGRQCLDEARRVCDESPDADAEFSIDEHHAYFTIGGVVVCGRNVADRFPEFKHALPKSFKGQCEVSRQDLARAIRTVNPFVEDRESSKIKVEISDGKLQVFGVSKFGECDDSIPALADGTLRANVNARYVLDAINSYVEDKVLIRFHDHKSALHLSPVSEGVRACFHMIMPMWD